MSDEVSILLIQDGVMVTSGPGVPTFACKDDVLGRGVTTSAEMKTYLEMVGLITGHDKVISC